MTYTSQPGTIPHKVIELLKSHPAGTAFSSAEISELIGQDKAMIAASLNYPQKMGALARSHKPGNKSIVYWSLGNGVPLPLPADHEHDEPLTPRQEVKTRQKAVADPQLMVTDVQRPANFAYNENGSLWLNKDGVEVVLDESETLRLGKFMTLFIQPRKESDV